MRTKTLVQIGFGLLILASLAMASGGDMPQVLYSTRPEIEYPVWVAAEAALDPNGKVNRKLFAEWAANTIDSMFTTIEPVDGCIPVTAAYRQHGFMPPSRETVREAARNVPFALHGRVTGRSYGFNESVPGQLLRLEPIELLKGEPENIAEYYVFFPVGDFAIGDHRICKSDNRLPETPEVGDELLVTDPWRVTKDDRFIETWGIQGLIVIDDDGTVHLPKRMKLGGDGEATEENGPEKTATEATEKLTKQRLLDFFRKAAGEGK
jgi:hypothetical protein